ncbi:hypothetical protein SAMN05443287_104442 [Micromonospora phaseoli]|uniref:Uncharacterized protein n=1 Tax=Micromonospora phaseoli TaxID=1144548 RepID=A0A1H6YTQ4_9ACTN|nr:hypothetical protein [Micromonospora phaseoli]PZW00412.1 hypothetical protein CLV64_103441 [Micromonospora phaseoli]GIJ76892.1 hypothetical protein Xph01_13240 [Micromonospora phaseoli]SEJ44651.1 hypothetical protein SAMN05443287_104442 [Micromonospora phaseoli]
MIDLVVRENAAWCDLICRTHGQPGSVDADAWSVPRRSPTWYPDAVTLRRGVGAELLGRIDAGPGASVKDSFADLDLAGHGLRVLFEAQWLHRPPAEPDGGPALITVATVGELTVWAQAHGGGPVFRPALLADPRVRILGLPDGHGGWAGGAVLHDAGRVMGVSNVFADSASAEQVWAGVCAAGAGRHLVGYEHGADLAVARRQGFRPVGPLRVWVR